jgi:hypothetical protein
MLAVFLAGAQRLSGGAHPSSTEEYGGRKQEHAARLPLRQERKKHRQAAGVTRQATQKDNKLPHRPSRKTMGPTVQQVIFSASILQGEPIVSMQKVSSLDVTSRSHH